MTERELAQNISNTHAQMIIDDNGGLTMDGSTLGKKYAERLHKAGGFDIKDVTTYEEALRHWVLAAGYGKGGRFTVIMSNHILNT